MTAIDPGEQTTAADLDVIDQRPVKRPTTSWRNKLSFRTIGAIYVWIGIIVFFSILEPDKFPTVATLRSVLNNEAVTGLIAISIVIPLASGVFDVSVGYIAGFAGVLSAWFLANTGLSPWPTRWSSSRSA
jgi:ribose/xylose/arabinose/galactoside ABC-type transport system permease subunit